MGVITIQDLKPGMVTAAPVKTTAGQLIIGKNTVLTESLITRMSFYNIQSVSVIDIKDTVEEEPKKIVAPEHELSYSQKVRKSSSFQKFQIDYTRHITNFNNYLKELVNTRTMNHATELVEIPKLLISETRTSIQFFDMIHNLRQIDDPIFAHSLNVAMIARMLGKWLHFSEADLDTLTLSAALHDVGKFLIPSDILNKETKLTDSEFAAIYKEAQKYVGTPYVWGGSTPETGFDCSGYVCWVYNQNGYDVGRTTANGLWNKSQHISEAEAKPGDLVFFEGTYDTPGKSHVGIYLGNGMMVSAGDPIKYANIHSSYWEKHLAGFGRLSK